MRMTGRMLMGLGVGAGLLLLNGCLSLEVGKKGETQVVANPARFQLVTLSTGASSGRVMRLDTVTGEIWWTQSDSVGGFEGWRKVDVKP